MGRVSFIVQGSEEGELYKVQFKKDTNICSQEDKKEKNDDCYPSAKLMLSVLQEQYKAEVDRGRSIDTRAGLFLAFSGSLLSFYASSIKFKDLLNVSATNIRQVIPIILLILFNIVVFISVVLTIFYFFRVINVKDYTKLSLSGFTSTVAENKTDDIACKIMESYKSSLEFNRKTNDGKVSLYKQGVQILFVAFVLTSIGYFLNQLIN